MSKRDDNQIVEGSGNVFADLKLPHADELQTRAELTRLIYNGIQDRGLTQTAAAKLLGLKQPDVSQLMAGRFTNFSTDRLLRLLMALDRDVEIIVRPKSVVSPYARIRVTNASI